MKKSEKGRIPVALRDVWSWKEAVYRETEKMNTAEALKKIHADADAVRAVYDLKEASPTHPLRRVAEEGVEYKTRPGKNLTEGHEESGAAS